MLHTTHTAQQPRPAWLIAALLLLAGTPSGFAASTPTRVPPVDSFVGISDDDGLAHSDVRSIVQDHDGFMWFGLRVAGLTRYDGYELKVYQHDPDNPRTIGNRIVWSLLVDRAGTLWVGTEGGLDRYDRATNTFAHFRHDRARADSISNNVVVCSLEDSRGQIWVGTRDGLCRLDDRELGKFTTFRRPQLIEGSTTKDTVRSITEDKTTGLFWLGTTDGLAAFDPRTGAFASFLHDPRDPTSLSRNAVNKVIRDEQGVFWAFTEYGINAFEPKFDRIAAHTVQQPQIAFRRYLQPSSEGPGANFVRDGLIDRKNRLWLATRGGLQLLDRATGTFTAYRRKSGDPTSLSDDLTQAVFEDRAGNIWVATYSGGVSRLRNEDKPFRVHQHEPNNPASLSEDRVTGVSFDASGHLWATTVHGLNRYDGKTWTRFMHDAADPNSIPTNDHACIAVGPDGIVWVGSNYDGIYRYDGRRFHSYPKSPSNAPAANGWQAGTAVQIHSVLPDANGGAWLGARLYGVDYFKDGRFLHYNPQQASANQPAQPVINAVFGFFGADGALWSATEANGMVRFDPRTQRFDAFHPPIEHQGVTRNLHCIADGGNGTIWLGAVDGLLKFDVKTERFTRQYSTVHGLPHAAVMTIVRDLRGHLWVATGNGLADFDPVNETFRIYEKPDGLPSNVFSQRCGTLGPDGRVYFGTRAGIVSFLPEELRDNPEPPPVVLTELKWLGAPTGDTGFQTDPQPNIGETVRVAAGRLGFSLKFSALDFTAPEKNRFRYRLEGWETEWNSSSARERTATYTALPPGKYTFHVQATNADGVWNRRGASVRVVVDPRLWQTTWFQVSMGLMSAGLVGAGLHWRLRSIRSRNALLQQQVSERTAELQQEIKTRQYAETALRESHQKLEQRVETRTFELAQTNLSLQAEIAERRRVEAQLRQSQKMEAIGQLAGGVAHDFNNLLTVILGQSDLLNDPGMSADIRRMAVNDIKAAAQRAANLTRQLLVFSRRQNMNPVAVDLNRVVVDVGKLLRHVIGEHITVETQLHPAPLGVVADAGMLEQVLLNLAVNARDAMPRGGRLTILTKLVTIAPGQTRCSAAAVPGEYACFSVSDTGEGISAEVMPQIFEPFFTTKESGKGTGLGLAISQGIVQQHRGWIEVVSRPGEGATFHIYLPSQPLAAPSPPALRDAGAHSTGDTTVLLVEDEIAVRSIVQRVLTRQGYRVIEATSGPEALALWPAHRDEIAILVTDIVMPGRPDGRDLALRLIEEKPALRVITMSGYDPGESLNAATGSHLPRPHLRKPFTADELLRAIESTARV